MSNRNTYFLATGVKVDIESFLTKFSSSETVRYEDFSKLWRERNLSFLFCGRETDMELREFTEDLLRITAEFLQPPFSFQVQVGALYLLYGFYFKQPNNPRARIRSTIGLWRNLHSFLQVVQEQKHMDVEFIYLKLLHTHAFEFVHSIVPETPFSMSRNSSTTIDEGGKEEQRREHLKTIGDSMLKDALNIDFLANLHMNYNKAKIALGPKGASKPHVSLNVIQNSFVDDIQETIKRHEAWRQRKVSGKAGGDDFEPQQQADSDSDQDWRPEDELSVGGRRARIRERAYNSAAPGGRDRRRQASYDHKRPQKSRKHQSTDGHTSSDEVMTATKSTCSKKVKTESRSSDDLPGQGESSDDSSYVPRGSSKGRGGRGKGKRKGTRGRGKSK